MRGLLPLANDLIRRSLVARGARSLWARVGRSEVHYLELGGPLDAAASPPALLLHGLGASACDWWRCLGPLARAGRRVVALDLPGFGFSPLPAGGPLGAAELEELVGQFASRVLGEPAVLIGNSLGGALAARVSATQPEQVSALVLIAPAGARMATGRMRDVLAQFAPTRRAARDLVRRVYNRPPPLLSFLVAEDLQAILSSPSVARLVREALEVEPLGERELASLRPGVLLLWGTGEKVLPAQSLSYFRAHLPPHAEVELVDGWGHCPQLERPADLCARIDAFLARALRSRVA